jgi:TetR/AcrR family transcriptional regulator, cholesterol catabolism regulator
MARSSDTLDRLFGAAVELLGERGYAGTTVDDIVARAGVAKGTVYYHFRSKAGLVAALLDDGLERLAALFEQEVQGAHGPQARLRALVHAELTYIQRYQAFSKLVMSEMWRVDRDWQEGLRVLRERYVSLFTAVIDAQSTASALFGMIVTAALDWLVFNPQRSLEEVEAGLQALVLGAVRA